MRTTLTIDDDVLRAAKQLADVKGESVGRVLSELARSALRRPAHRGVRNGVTLLSVRPDAGVVTLDEVNRLRDEIP